MGIIIQSRKFSSSSTTGLLKPIIYCCHYEESMKQAVSINKPLAEKLIVYKPDRRTLHVEQSFAEVMNTLPDECIIKDFDVMFNPIYKIDVLNILVRTCKSKLFSVIWPGSLVGDKLIYAEEGYSDYKSFDINKYDVTCVR